MAARRRRVAPALALALLATVVGWPRAEAAPQVAGLGADSVGAVGGTPNDTLWPAQWGMRSIGVPQAWASLPGGAAGAGRGALVAIVGQGVHGYHEDLRGAVAGDGYACQLIPALERYGCTDSAPIDESVEGTYLAGVVGAAVNNGAGIAGIAPAATILGVDVDVTHDGTADRHDDDLIPAFDANPTSSADGIRGALRRGAKVILTTYNAKADLTCATTSEAIAAGAIVIVPAGTNTVASCPDVIGVGGYDPDGNITGGAGADLALMAPGKDIWTTRTSCCEPGEEAYGLRHGSPIAAAHVAGVVAMLLGDWDPDLDARTALRILASQALRPGGIPLWPDARNLGCNPACPWSSVIGYGVVYPAKAVANRPRNFTLTVPDDVGLGRGGSVTVPVGVGSTTAPVALSVRGSIPGGSVTFGASPTTGATTMVVTTSASTPPGTHRVTVVGEVAGWPQLEPVDVHVDTVEVGVAEPLVRRTAGMTATYDLTLTRHGSPGPVTLSVEGLPAATTASFDDPTPTGDRARLSVTTSPTTAYTCGTTDILESMFGIELRPDADVCFDVPTPWGAHELRIVSEVGGTRTVTPVELIAGNRVDLLTTVGHGEGVVIDCATFRGGVCTSIADDDRSLELFLPTNGHGATYNVVASSGSVLGSGNLCAYVGLRLGPGARELRLSLHSARSALTCATPRAGYLPAGQTLVVHRTH